MRLLVILIATVSGGNALAQPEQAPMTTPPAPGPALVAPPAESSMASGESDAAPPEPAATPSDETDTASATVPTGLSPSPQANDVPAAGLPRSFSSNAGFGFDMGPWGSTLGVGVRLQIPFTGWGAVVLRAVSLNELWQRRHDLGGRVELRGQSRIIWGLVRTYAGAGAQFFVPVRDDMYGGSRQGFSWGVGGHFGVELFTKPGLSWFVEIGGHRGSDPYSPRSSRGYWASGGTAVAGVMFYPSATR